MIDELGGTEDLQPLSERLGDGVQHAVQDVEALRVQRRHRRPVHRLVAGGIEGARRDPRPVPPRDRPRTDDPRRRSASSRPRRSTGTRRASSTASACATASTTAAPTAHARPSSTRCSALAASGTTAGRRSRPIRRSAGWGNFNDDDVGALPHRRRPLGAARSRRGAAGEAAGADHALVRRGRRATAHSRSTTARRSRSSSTPRPQLLDAPRNRYVYFPDTAEVPESQAVNIRNRSFAIGAARRHPEPQARRACSSRTARGSAGTRSTSRTTGSTTSTTSSACSSRVVGTEDVPDRREPDPLRRLRQGGRRAARRGRPGCSRSTTATRRSAREGSRRSRASSRSPAKGSASGATAATGVTEDYPGAAPCVHRRHDQPGRGRRQRRAVRRPRAPSRDADPVPVAAGSADQR